MVDGSPHAMTSARFEIRALAWPKRLTPCGEFLSSRFAQPVAADDTMKTVGPSATTRRSSGARAVALMLGQWLVLGGCWEPVVREVFEPGGGWSGPVGDMGEACVPADDDVPSFSGFAVGEVNISTEDGRCSSGTCLVHHFQGRVSCPEGNLDEGDCFTPSGALVSVAVQPQLAERPADLTVHCSCRCDGPRSLVRSARARLGWRAPTSGFRAATRSTEVRVRIAPGCDVSRHAWPVLAWVTGFGAVSSS